MRKSAGLLAALLLLLSGLILSFKLPADEHPTLAIGAKAPDFSLQGVDGKTYTLNSFKNSPILMVVFTCNHCPTAQAYEDRIIKITKDYKDKGVAIVAIMPNDPKAIRLDELGYTDMSDTFDEMKLRAANKHFNFPYLYDGATQSVAHAYGPIATPHVFIFNKERKLCYSGRIDDVEKPTKTPHVQDTRDALNALLAGKTPDETTTKVFGCSIKWAEKASWLQKAQDEWAKEPVTLTGLDGVDIKALFENKTDNLKVITIWTTANEAGHAGLPAFVEMNRMYRRRDFEMISINVDGAAKTSDALRILKQAEASFANYIIDGSKDQAIASVDPKWSGALPYTLIVEPAGKIVYAKQGAINPAEVKKAIVDDPTIGRYY
ncbi:MAG TPA: redoxin family protein [Mucilaginibacter sp.]|jgi:peroxiredoxin|nr:redoxin family protein [Mucilaginibacter sp.]